MSLKEACGREFAELVADHVFGDIDSYKFPAIVDVEVQADEVGSDYRTPRPSLDWLAGVRLLRFVDFILETRIYKRTFFNLT